MPDIKPLQGPQVPHKLVYDFTERITPDLLIAVARREGLHPYNAAYRMHDPLPWGFGQILWIEERAAETRARLNVAKATKLGDEYGLDVLQTMCDFLNSKVPKFAVPNA